MRKGKEKKEKKKEEERRKISRKNYILITVGHYFRKIISNTFKRVLFKPNNNFL